MSDTLPVIGVAWYPEQWPEERWPRDLELMRQCGIDVVRIGEFCWSRLQPAADRWDWAWLDRAVSQAAATGLRVILCTPTASPPPWMFTADPSLAIEGERLGTMRYGKRHLATIHHEGYRRACREVAEKLARRYGGKPAVLAFQVDNEPGSGQEDVGPLAQAAFRRWLTWRHGDPKVASQRLGLVFWGQEISDWNDLDFRRSQNALPGLVLEWCRFLSESWIAFCREQVSAMRPHVGEAKITTNCHTLNWNQRVDWLALMRQAGFDLLSFDNYTATTYEGAFHCELARAVSRPFWILEQQTGLAVGQHLWPQPADTVERSFGEAATHGAELVSFFRWRQPLFGAERNHGAVLDHHGEPGTMYRRVRSLAEGRRTIAYRRPRVGLHFAWENAWAGTAGPATDTLAYFDLMVHVLYRGFHEAGEAVSLVLEPEQLKTVQILVLGPRPVHDATWEKTCQDFVGGGGVLVTFPLLFAWDEYAAVRVPYLSDATADLCGFQLDRRIPLRQGEKVQVELAGHGHLDLRIRLDAVLPVAETEVIGRFTDGPLKGRPAITVKHGDQGAVLHVCGFPDPAGAASILGHAKTLVKG